MEKFFSCETEHVVQSFVLGHTRIVLSDAYSIKSADKIKEILEAISKIYIENGLELSEDEI